MKFRVSFDSPGKRLCQSGRSVRGKVFKYSKKRESNPVPVVHEFEDVEIMTIKDYHKIVEKEISAIEIDLFGSKSVELTLKQKPKSVKKRKTSVKSKNRASTSS
jgi:hypothetical protein